MRLRPELAGRSDNAVTVLAAAAAAHDDPAMLDVLLTWEPFRMGVASAGDPNEMGSLETTAAFFLDARPCGARRGSSAVRRAHAHRARRLPREGRRGAARARGGPVGGRAGAPAGARAGGGAGAHARRWGT